jgi:hypothetical protein
MRKAEHAFTIAELLVSIAVLVVLILMVSRLFTNTAIVTMSGNKRMDAEAQLRPIFDRMAVDFSQMVTRSDFDFFGKNTAAPNSIGGSMTGNDQIAFFSTVAGYYPSSTLQSPLSLVSYRINSTSTSGSFNKLERLAKGLLWNGASTTDAPILLMPLTIGATWPTATNANSDPDYELIGPNVFRFEYYYLLKNGSLSDTPTAIQNVAAFAIAIATVDPRSRVLLSDSQVTTLAGRLTDFTTSMKPGDLLDQWQTTLDGVTDMPRPAISAVRIYERYFHP